MQIIIICKSRNLIENTNYYCTIFIDNIPTDIASMQQQKPPQPNITKSSASANAIVELKIQQTANRTSRKKSLSNMNEMANGKLVSIKKNHKCTKKKKGYSNICVMHRMQISTQFFPRWFHQTVIEFQSNNHKIGLINCWTWRAILPIHMNMHGH